MIYTLRCKTCNYEFGTVAETKHLELACPRCRRTTTFSTLEPDGRPELYSSDVLRGQEQRPESTDRILRKNRGIDHWKC